MAKPTIELTVVFTYDNLRGVFEGRAKGGTNFFFGGAVDAPLPKTLHNALTSLRRLTMEVQTGRTVPMDSDEDISEELKEKIRQFEARGGRVQTVGPRKSSPKVAPSKLTIEDLDL